MQAVSPASLRGAERTAGIGASFQLHKPCLQGDITKTRSRRSFNQGVMNQLKNSRLLRNSLLTCSTMENADVQEPVMKDFSLPSDALLNEVKFGLMGEGKVQYVVITKVAPGSLCEEAGLRPGQKIKKISDPIRNTEMWELADNASLRFVRDAVRYRRADTIDLVIQDEGKSYDDSNLTVGQRLEREWAQQQEGRNELTAAQQRIKRRKEYMEKSGEGNSGAFFAVVFGLFALPPLVILLVAYFTGYLDALYQDVLR